MPVVPSPNSRDTLTQKPSGRSCTTDPSHCICCSDEAIAGHVLALLPGGVAAVDFGGVVEEVSVALIETAPGDSILVHAKVAIARAAQSETRSGALAAGSMPRWICRRAVGANRWPQKPTIWWFTFSG